MGIEGRKRGGTFFLKFQVPGYNICIPNRGKTWNKRIRDGSRGEGVKAGEGVAV